jgi:hypothetical protein
LSTIGRGGSCSEPREQIRLRRQRPRRRSGSRPQCWDEEDLDAVTGAAVSPGAELCSTKH